MKLETVLHIVQRDRAIEMLRSRHHVLRGAAGLYLAATKCFYPAPAAYSATAFDHLILRDLATAALADVERKYLSLLLGVMEATSSEYLHAICRRRHAYAAVLPSVDPDAQARHRYPAAAQIEHFLVAAAVAFEHAGIALSQMPATEYDGLWARYGKDLGAVVRQAKHLVERMDSALRYAARQERRARHQTDIRILASVAITAAVVAAVTLAWRVFTF